MQQLLSVVGPPLGWQTLLTSQNRTGGGISHGLRMAFNPASSPSNSSNLRLILRRLGIKIPAFKFQYGDQNIPVLIKFLKDTCQDV